MGTHRQTKMLRAGISVVVAVLVLANDTSAHKVFHVNQMTRHFALSNQRRFSYASGSGGNGGVPASSYASASGYSSGKTTTTTTTTTGKGTTTGKSSGFTPVSGSTKITQKITFSHITVSQYTGDLKLCYETGYGKGLGLLNEDKSTFKAGAKVESSAKAASRRAGTAVTFEATAPPSLAAAAKSNAAAIATDTAKLVTAISDVKTANSAFSTVTVPTASQITADKPTNEVIVSAAPTSSGVSLLTIIALAAATLAFN